VQRLVQVADDVQHEAQRHRLVGLLGFGARKVAEKLCSAV
jgi:hypothetical protein